MNEFPDDVDTLAFPARTIMSLVSDEIVMTEPSTSLRAAAVVLAGEGVGCVVIGSISDVEGIVSERDIVQAVATGMDLDETTVADIETKTLHWATPDSTIDDVAEEMLETYVRHVLIGEDQLLIGIVSMRDVLSAYLD